MKRVNSSNGVSRVFIPWKRPEFKQDLIVVPLMHPVVIWQMHRHAKRLTTCRDSDCVRCLAKIPVEYRCIFPAIDIQEMQVCIVDVPGCHAEAINGISELREKQVDIAVRLQRKRPLNGPITCSPTRREPYNRGQLWDVAKVESMIETLLRSNDAFSDELLASVAKSNS